MLQHTADELWETLASFKFLQTLIEAVVKWVHNNVVNKLKENGFN